MNDAMSCMLSPVPPSPTRTSLKLGTVSAMIAIEGVLCMDIVVVLYLCESVRDQEARNSIAAFKGQAGRQAGRRMSDAIVAKYREIEMSNSIERVR